MYAQNTVEPDSSTVRDSVIPVGFAQTGMNFSQPAAAGVTRPQGTVGPYEHIEQPPPYTRYAEIRAAEERPVEGDVAARSGDMPIPLQNLAPTPQSPVIEDDPNRPQTRISSGSNVSRHSQAQLNTVGTSDSQSTVGQKWSKKGKRRVCQGKVPVWALVLAIVLTALLIVLVTGIAVGVKHIRSKDEGARASQTAPPP